MTVGELKAKLAMYNDDTEIYAYQYDDLSCQDAYFDPVIRQEDVRTYLTRRGYLCYTNLFHHEESKQHTVLVIG